MSREAKLSLIGLKNWNDGLFDLLVIPEGLNKEIFTDNLMAETAELEVLYPNYEVMRTLIGVWSHKMLPVWQHLYDTTMYKYDPIQNYNRTEIETINGEGNRVHSGTDRTTHGGQNTNNQTTTNTGDNRHSIAGFDSVPSANSDGLVLNDTDDAHNTEIVNGTLAFGKTEQLVHGEQIADTNQSTRENHISGNIGVTTTQKMIREEREIAEFNIYDRMIKDFMDRFCIMVF